MEEQYLLIGMMYLNVFIFHICLYDYIAFLLLTKMTVCKQKRGEEQKAEDRPHNSYPLLARGMGVRNISLIQRSVHIISSK